MANRWTVVTGLLLLPLLWVPVRAQAGSVTVVETAPVETVMDDPNVPEAWTVWQEMLRGARSHVEIAGFYFSNRDSSRLEAVLQEVLAAGARGVQVRVLGDRGFYDTYPETLNRLATSPGIEARLIDFRALAGGPMHAKYFIVDGHEAFVGSQNWDWRALEHIHELGLRVTLPAYVAMLHAVFAYDWERATGLGSEPLGEIPALATEEPSVWEWMGPDSLVSRMRPAMSPKGYLPDETQWDLPQILGLIDGAQDSLQVTLL